MLNTNIKAMELAIQQIEKKYPNGVKALDGINLQIGKGMFGLLGPNGAGKSSLMRTIATLQEPDKGTIHFDEMDILQQQFAFRKMLGYLPQEFGVYPHSSAEDLLNYFARLKGISAKKDRNRMVAYVLEITNLYDDRKKQVIGYSGGMKQRFGIAQLLLNQPKVLIVDEPTAGLDPAERTRFLNVIRRIGHDNIVIFSTHIVEDIRDICHSVAIMNKGKILQHTTTEEALKKIRGKVWAGYMLPEETEQPKSALRIISNSYDTSNQLVARVYGESAPGAGFQQVPADLEDYYFSCLYGFLQ